MSFLFYLSLLLENTETSRENIKNLLNKGEYECVICLGKISRRHAIYSCPYCARVFHFHCFKQWSLTEKPSSCPFCRKILFNIPEVSTCFCGKVRKPKPSLYEDSHTCGELCGRLMNCGKHRCNLLCHPGNCMECTTLAKPISCWCGKQEYVFRCGQEGDKCCYSICNKLLLCGKHCKNILINKDCEEICHEGDCIDCLKESEPIECYCGKELKNQICGKEHEWSCNQLCNKLLSCSKHNCPENCHKGDCPICFECPNPINNTKCNKLLSCRIHKCKSLRHPGKCSKCLKEREIPCLCGKETFHRTCGDFTIDNKPLENGEILKCKTKCNQLLSCKRHRCKEKCCISNHICKNICNQFLNCNIHRCNNICHSGTCTNCSEYLFEDIKCTCGKILLQSPYKCGSKIPECNRTCKRIMINCGHQAYHMCHLESEPCPPCSFPVEKLCMCGKTLLKRVPCHIYNPSCGKKCKKILSCGHRCPLKCHKGDCMKLLQKKFNISNESSESCGMKCKKIRNCGHPCEAICHKGDCPNIICEHSKILTCKCERIQKKVPCLFNGLNEIEINYLDCDEICIQEQWLKKIKTEIGLLVDEIIDKNKFTDYLIYFIKEDRDFIIFIEDEFEAFIEMEERQLQLQAMPNREYRRAVYQLAKIYGLFGKTIGHDEEATILLNRTRRSRVPFFKLSQIVNSNVRINKSKLLLIAPIDLLSLDPSIQPCLLLFNIDPSQTTRSIRDPLILLNDIILITVTLFLTKWIDSKHALIICSNNVVLDYAKSVYKKSNMDFVIVSNKNFLNNVLNDDIRLSIEFQELLLKEKI